MLWIVSQRACEKAPLHDRSHHHQTAGQVLHRASTISGVEAAYKALRRRGKIARAFRFIAFDGDGGKYDIGLQSLSGAMERGQDMVYVCYDNGAYMNTGVQRS
jgi:pyruvate/2-oxoacid:ferredoxin oxidoreductase beta subunit